MEGVVLRRNVLNVYGNHPFKQSLAVQKSELIYLVKLQWKCSPAIKNGFLSKLLKHLKIN